MTLLATLFALVPLRSASAAGGTVDVRVSSSSDDAEENLNGDMYLTSSDLELTTDSRRGVQTVGFRFASVAIPQGATITSAVVTFEADETSSESTRLKIAADRSSDASRFTSTARNLSSRSTTDASVDWQPGAWGRVSEKHTTPDLSTVVQELTSRVTWREGNAIAFIVTGTGKRVAESYDGESSNAPSLRVTYESNVAGGPTPVPPPPTAAPLEKLATPVVAAGSVQGDNVVFNWGPIEGRVEYHVQYFLPDGHNVYGTTKNTSYAVPTGGASGVFCLEVRAVAPGRDSDLSNRACATVVPPFAQGAESTEAAVSSSSDDAEERSNGTVNLTSSDLELTTDSNRGQQTVGIRFGSVDVPRGATITSAVMTFETDETSSDSTNLSIAAQAGGSAAGFTTAWRNVSSRVRTSASVQWRPGPWNTISQTHDTPDLSRVVQEVTDRNDWRAGSSMAFIITGTGKRVAESYDGERSGAPRLKITYSSGDQGVPSPTIINPPQIAGDGFMSVWRTADPAAGEQYEVRWSLNGTTFDEGGSQISGAAIDVEPPDSTGQVCGQARTRVVDADPSDWSPQSCFQFSGVYDSPNLSANPVVVVGSRATISWTRASNAPSDVEHRVRWTKNGYPLKTEIVGAGRTNTSHIDASEPARLCATVETYGSGNRLSSKETSSRCGVVNPSFSVVGRSPSQQLDGLVAVPVFVEPGPNGLIGVMATGAYDSSALELIACDSELEFNTFSCVPNEAGTFSLLLSGNEAGALNGNSPVALMKFRPLRATSSQLSFVVESGHNRSGTTHGFGATTTISAQRSANEVTDWDGTTEILNFLMGGGDGDIDINGIQPQQADDGRLYGDVDCSGERDILDALIMIQVLNGVLDIAAPEAECFGVAADINRNGSADQADVQMVLECLVGFGFSECDLVVVSELVLDFELTKPQADDFRSEWTALPAGAGDQVNNNLSGLSISVNEDPNRANIVMAVDNRDQRLMINTDCSCDDQELVSYDLNDTDLPRQPSDSEGVTWIASGFDGGQFKHTIAIVEEDRNEVNIVEFCETCNGTKLEALATYELAALRAGSDGLEALVYVGTDTTDNGLAAYAFFVGDEVTGTIHRVVLPTPAALEANGQDLDNVVVIPSTTHSWEVSGGLIDEVTGLSTVPGYDHVLVGVADDGEWPDDQTGYIFAVDLRAADGSLMDSGAAGVAALITPELGEELQAGRLGPFHQPEGVILKTATGGWIASEPFRVGSIVASPN